MLEQYIVDNYSTVAHMKLYKGFKRLNIEGPGS